MFTAIIQSGFFEKSRLRAYEGEYADNTGAPKAYMSCKSPATKARGLSGATLRGDVIGAFPG